MHNKKTIVRGLAFGIALSNMPVDSLANTIDKYEIVKEESKIEQSIRKIFNILEPKKAMNTNRGIVKSSVLEITLTDGQFVPNLTGNPDGYETIKVTTTGNKKLVKADYDNLRTSKIPKIDLSSSYADEISAGAFSDAFHLTEFKFPMGVTVIRGGSSYTSGAFYNCFNLTGKLTIPSSVRTIEDNAFRSCNGFTGDLLIPNSVTSIGNSAFQGCSRFDGNLIIPNSVTSIGSYAFSGCSKLTGDLIIPDSITIIEDNVFRECSGFTGDLIIPNSVTSIGEDAFYKCRGLNGDLIISDSVTSIGKRAFQYCNGFKGNLRLSNSLTVISDYAFYECSGFTGDLVIPEGVTGIGYNSFYKCSGFNGRLTLPSSLVSIDSSFNGCSGLKGNLIIPNSVTYISSSSFYGCSGFTGELVLPEAITGIGYGAFSGCSGLEGSLIIPDTVEFVEDNAFYNTGIEKIILKVDESFRGVECRKNVLQFLDEKIVYLDMPYNFDISNTWLATKNYKKAINISTYVGKFENSKGMGVTLEILTPYSESNISVTKDGSRYDLPNISNGKYIFKDTGVYELNITTNLGVFSNIVFENNTPVLEPTIEYLIDKNYLDSKVSITDNGVLKNRTIEYTETFSDSNDLKFNFSNSNWAIESENLKSEVISHSSRTENEFKFNAQEGDKIQINVKTSSEGGGDWGYIYVNGVEVYKKSGTSNDFEIIECDLQEGENIVKFMYQKDSFGSSGSDAMFIDYIKVLSNEIITVDSDILEYRIDGGEWKVYNDAFELNYPVGNRITLEARARHDGFVSSIARQNIIVELNVNHVEDCVDKAEQSKDAADIEDARDLVNSMPESSKKDEFQDRLDAIFPNITLEKRKTTASFDMYIKPKNTLSLSLDTNSINFEDYSNVESMEKLNALNITVNSSLPYDLNAYMPTEISNTDGTNKMDLNVLNIRESGESNYQVFKNTVDKIVLKQNCRGGINTNHSIDLKLNSSAAHKSDVYKTVIKFEAEQK